MRPRGRPRRRSGLFLAETAEELNAHGEKVAADLDG
jgi:hypothetical protein